MGITGKWMFAKTSPDALTQYLVNTKKRRKKISNKQCCFTDHKWHQGFIVKKQSHKGKETRGHSTDFSSLLYKETNTFKMWQLENHYK